MTAVHELKVVPPFMDAITDGSKTFEVRQDDRGFAVDDRLHLMEWSPEDGYTGRAAWRTVTYVLRDAEAFGVAPGYVVMGLV